MEMDDNIHEIEDTNNITLPQNNPDDPRQACTLKRELGLLSEKEAVALVLEEKEVNIVFCTISLYCANLIYLLYIRTIVV